MEQPDVTSDIEQIQLEYAEFFNIKEKPNKRYQKNYLEFLTADQDNAVFPMFETLRSFLFNT